MSIKRRKPSSFWTPERLRYWRDFDEALPLVGAPGAYLYAGTRKLIRNANVPRKAKRAPRTGKVARRK